MNLAGKRGYGCWFWASLPAFGVSFIMMLPFVLFLPDMFPVFFTLGVIMGILNGRFDPFPFVKEYYDNLGKETKQE